MTSLAASWRRCGEIRKFDVRSQEAGPPTNIGGLEAPPDPHTEGELNPMPMPAEFSQLDITSTAARIREQKKTRANGFWRLMDDPTQKGYF